MPDPSTVRRWAQRRLLSVWCWIKIGVKDPHFLQTPTIAAWDLSALCRILYKGSVQKQIVENIQSPGDKKRHVIKRRVRNSKPANSGAIAAPVVRATPVMPAAAALSSGATTAMM